ncbi:8-amino-7-oxononanoate synthase [Spinactinospora alkalitolerans]|uniref:8-amino-7-oxononanoate synthase n=1 Tax=Spinactinospora alkalitolerans TaxID=687207 RepID=A0A852TWF1_9ACTN|nr:8-amino-7-oxononanoate synthase [Spinactinospora alkalitolerans]NYE46180.1 8-amino-7-oxononanoate synthase [Spinactinospora alkalitolerans]
MTADVQAADPFGWLERAAAERARAGLTRRLRPRGRHEDVLDLAGNDYLGLTRHPVVTRAAADAAVRWGAGATGSRLVTGSTALHGELEAELTDFHGAEAALVFSSGFAANLGMVTALSGAGTHLVCDRYNHASLIDATRLAKASGARVSLFGHADAAAARAALAAAAEPRRLVVSDTVFSVDGDLADVAGLARACREHGAALVLDDAHGLGVLGDSGAGALSAAGLSGAGDVVVSVTLSKSLGAQGGAVLGPRGVIRHLAETARTFVFDTGLAPASAGGALAALRLLRAEPERAARVRSTARRLAAGLTAAGLRTGAPGAAVVSVRAPSPDAAVQWARRCLDAGVRVGCFRPPSVPDGHSRLRLTARADLTEDEIGRALEVVTATRPEGLRRS